MKTVKIKEDDIVYGGATLVGGKCKKTGELGWHLPGGGFVTVSYEAYTIVRKIDRLYFKGEKECRV